MVKPHHRNLVDCGIQQKVSWYHPGIYANRNVWRFVDVSGNFCVSDFEYLFLDPDGFNNLLRALPYHADTLLQLSEVYNHREGI